MRTKIIQNAIRVKDKIINSVHVHDCLTIEEKRNSGDVIEFMIDGGKEYFRGNRNSFQKYYEDNNDNVPEYGIEDFEFEDLRLHQDTSTITEIKNKLLWGTYGKSGKEPLKFVKLIDCEIEHLENILRNIKKLNPLYEFIIILILMEKNK